MARPECHILKGAAILAKRNLALGPAVQIVKNGFRHSATRQRPEILDANNPGDATLRDALELISRVARCGPRIWENRRRVNQLSASWRMKCRACCICFRNVPESWSTLSRFCIALASHRLYKAQGRHRGAARVFGDAENLVHHTLD
jgi:hypothetical protein